MNADDFDELAGRVEGIGRTLVLLIVEAQKSKTVDENFSHRLRSLAGTLNFECPQLEATKRTMVETAQAIEHVRMNCHK